MDKTQEALEKETRKWLEKLEAKEIPATGDKQVREQLTNVKAYVSDCKHFLGKKDYIRAFEAIIYAWGIAETLERLKLIRGGDKEKL